MKKIQVRPVFVNTKNVRNFQVMMDGLNMSAGEGRLGLVYGRAGRGKTRTCQWYSAHKNCVYLRVATIWRTGELDFLRSLCRELGILQPPRRKGPAFSEVVDTLLSHPKPVFIDEIEKLPGIFLDLVRDISDMSTAPFILVGEEELVSFMQRNRRVWSRTYNVLEFDPIGPSDIIFYGKDAAGLALSADVANYLHRQSGGDWRIVRRDLLALVQVLNAKGIADVDLETVKLAVKTGLRPMN